MKLELKHVQCYPMDEDNGILVQTCTRTHSRQGKPLGYKVGRLIGVSVRTECEILFDKDDFAEDYNLDQIKPILRDLSDLTKEIEVNGEKFVPMEKIMPLIESHQEELNKPLNNDPFEAMLINLHSSNNIYNKLLELHFDVFDLHSKNLCVYYDELNK